MKSAKLLLFFLFVVSIATAQTVCAPVLPANAPNYNTSLNFTVQPPTGDIKYYTQGQATITASTPIITSGVKRFYSTSKISLTNGFKATSGASTRFVAAIVPNCTAPITKQVEETTKETIETTSGITIYPNPTKGKFAISFDNWLPLSVIISDSQGKTVYNNNTIKENILQVDISNFPVGIYQIVFVSNNGNWVKKIIKI